MRNWVHASLIDSISSVPLKELARKTQERINLNSWAVKYVAGRLRKSRSTNEVRVLK